MAWTSTDLTNLEQAIALGATKVKYQNGNEVEYRSLKEMIQLRDTIRRDLGLIPKSGKKIYPKYSKGF